MQRDTGDVEEMDLEERDGTWIQSKGTCSLRHARVTMERPWRFPKGQDHNNH